MKGYSGWNYKPFYTIDQIKQKDCPYIAAIRPGDGCVELEWYDETTTAINHSICLSDDEKICAKIEADGYRVLIRGLENGKTYYAHVVSNENEEKASQKRRVGIAPVIGKPINYLHPEDTCYEFSGYSLCSPGIMKLKNGTLLVSMDVYGYRKGQNLTKIFASYDRGQTWTYLTDLFPCFWGKMFEFKGAVYMLAYTTEYGNVVIGKSEDEGKTWSEFVKLFPGSANRDGGGPHRAPLNIMEHDGRLWTSVDFGTWEKGGHMSGVLSVSVDDDLMKAESWIMSDFLPYSPSWKDAADGESAGCLEGNIVKLPDGTLCNLLRYQINKCTPNHDRAVLLKIDTKQPEKQLELYKIIDFMGGLSKFSVVYDEVSNKYFALVNRVTDVTKVMSRNVLSLVTSDDAIHWEFIRDVVDCSAYENAEEKIGMQYPDLMIDGEDLIWVQRTAMNNAKNFHDSNYITFHRLNGFRRYIYR